VENPRLQCEPIQAAATEPHRKPTEVLCCLTMSIAHSRFAAHQLGQLECSHPTAADCIAAYFQLHRANNKQARQGLRSLTGGERLGTGSCPTDRQTRPLGGLDYAEWPTGAPAVQQTDRLAH
jgi:hypothetical protein